MSKLIKGTIFKELLVVCKCRALNTSVDFGWILFGEKGPHLKMFFPEPILVVDRATSLNYIYCKNALPVAVHYYY